MKRSMITIAAILFFGVAATYAQQDTTMRSGQEQTSRDMVKIEANDLPDPVKQSLSDPKYKGWESGEVYRNQASDQYMINVNEGNRPKSYYFDAQGKPIEE